jgi:predicted nuclease of predicted toxin-antitoxin system
MAQSQGRVIVSADTDFGALIAQAKAVEPSVVLVVSSLRCARLSSRRCLSATLSCYRQTLKPAR